MIFSPDAYWSACWQEHKDVVTATSKDTETPFRNLLYACKHVILQEGKIVFFGNGGSAADAQHLATELTVRFSKNRKPIAALALTTDTSALTAIGNDYDFSCLFSRQVEALCKKEDLVIGITTSGKSPNVIKAIQAAKDIGATTATFTGGTGGDIAPLVDHAIIIPSTTTARIQEMHITIGQLLCGALEQELGLVE